MSRKQLNRMLFIENMLIGMAAIVVGLGTGLLFAKLILLISAKVMAVDNGLPFYFPLKALVITAVSYSILFLLIAGFSSVMLRKGTLLALVKAEDAPKPQPKASPWLALLALLLIVTGYGMVMVFSVLQIFSFLLLLGGVVLVIGGTYFLFTQFSVYLMRYLQNKKPFFFRRTNLLTISELIYRMKDNAVMFFLVSVISASAFTGIGTTLAIGDPGLSAMENPYAYTYSYYEEEADRGKKDLEIVRQELDKAGFAYREGSVTPAYSDNGIKVIKLSEYNMLVESQGYPAETLGEDEGILTPGTVTEKNNYRINGLMFSEMEIDAGNEKVAVDVIKAETFIAVPDSYGVMLVVSDSLYDWVAASEEYSSSTYHTFFVPDWKDTGEVTRTIMNRMNESGEYSYYLKSLYLQWKGALQQNGILLIVSGLVGIVFFTFAASFVYFRLYTDLARDEQQYRMIAKVGLSRRELRTIVTRQLVMMFFLPMLVALIHTVVAFVGLQQLVDFSIVGHSVNIFIFFLGLQIVYFLVTRWRYLNRMYHIIQ